MTSIHDIKHDPAFPYAVRWGSYVAARFPAGNDGLANAEDYAGSSAGKVVDTTPAPKIPTDAEFIAWSTGAKYSVGLASKDADGEWWYKERCYTQGGILALIGDAEVTVLEKRSN